mgnify:FL=1|jgi:spore germination protein KA
MGRFNKSNKNNGQENMDFSSPENLGTLSGNYEEDIKWLKEIFKDDDSIVFRRLNIGVDGSINASLIFFDGLVDSAIIDNNIIKPLTELEQIPKEKSAEDIFLSKVVQIDSVKKVKDLDEIIQEITYGDTLLVIDGIGEGLLFSTKNFESRSISEPEGEKILSGPREGFTEVIITNLSLVRRKLRTNKLKMKYFKLGKETNTQICVAYLDNIAAPKTLKELYRRLGQIDIDGILDANYINELIRDNPWSPFRSIGYTERPDVVSAKLLEGRIAIFVDGTPVVLTLPYLFIENFQSNEDYYLSFYYTSFSRILRILGFFLTTLVPAIYIAVTAFHQEMLPAPLLISIAIERQKVPLPAAVEAFIMLIVFEILKETALRMQTNVGQALSIVGALVLGQAAVEANLVAAPMIIVIAITGITSILVPRMNAPIFLIRFIMLILASFLGFFGVTIGFALMLTHILSLKSFGNWQLASASKLNYQTIKDTIIRGPWYRMILRPRQLTGNAVRQKNTWRGQDETYD